ncbi:HEAT repeat domain-containing protein [Streptomyces sp. NPDC003691]
MYLFPVLPSFTLTHQWLRELARHKNPRGMSAVDVLLPDDEAVLVGHYGEPSPAAVSAAEAVGRITALDDPRGWEVFLPRAVAPAEIRRVRAVPQGVGWRYRPDVHGRRPCPCLGCAPVGSYGAARLRRRLARPEDEAEYRAPWPGTPALLERIADAEAAGDAAALARALMVLGRRDRGPLREVARLADHPHMDVRETLAFAVTSWRTPGAAELLERLAADPARQVAVAARDGLTDRAWWSGAPNPDDPSDDGTSRPAWGSWRPLPAR